MRKFFYKTIQKWYCKSCQKYQRSKYRYKLHEPAADHHIALLTKESMSISSISRYLNLAKTTVRRRLYHVSKTVSTPVVCNRGEVYEMDEMHTFIGKRAPGCYIYILLTP